MGFLKFFFKGIGGLLLFIAITTFYFGLFTEQSLNQLNLLTDSLENNLEGILKENQGYIVDSAFEKANLEPENIKKICKQKLGELPEDFCLSVKNFNSPKEIKSALINTIVNEAKSELQNEIKDFKEKIEQRLERPKEYIKYYLPASILLFLLGSLFMFLAEKFQWKSAIFNISMKTGILSGLTALGNYFTKNITPEQISKLTGGLPVIDSKGGYLVMDLISRMLADFIKIPATKVFSISSKITIVSFLIAVIITIIKHKKPQSKKITKKEENKNTKSNTKKEKNLKKDKKKKFKKKKRNASL